MVTTVKAIAVGFVVLLTGFLCYAVFAGDIRETKKEVVPVVESGNMVRVHYTLTVDGKVVDTSRDREPLEYQAGKNQLIPGFEKALIGMKKGEKKSFKVEPEEGYGKKDPKMISEVSKDRIPPDLNPEPGMTLYARGAGGNPVPVKVVEVKKDVVILDFNHPLAGKVLNFDVEIIDIK
jgi:peptidylprolyl isomerase